MEYKLANLKPDEIATLRIRGIYEQAGYKKYRMSRFEEYNLYAENKDFLGGEKVITFTDLDGRLLALKPDVTLSIINNSRATRKKPEKLYYIENVYRECKESHTYKEISQMGLEYIGDINEAGVVEVIDLAAQTLSKISPKYILELSHMDFVLEMLNEFKMADVDKFKMIKQIRNRNIDGMLETGKSSMLSKEQIEKICIIPSLQGNVDQVITRARQIVLNEKMGRALDTLENIYAALKIRDSEAKVKLDLSTINDIDYYNGVIFKGYIEGTARSVLAGGQYDRAMLLFDKDVDAIGFALYLNEISRMDLEDSAVENPGNAISENEMLYIALPKG